MAKTPEMFDMLGRVIQIGDAVAFNPGTYPREELWAGRVDRFTRKKVSVSWTSNGHVQHKLIFPRGMVVIPLEDYLPYALARS